MTLRRFVSILSPSYSEDNYRRIDEVQHMSPAVDVVEHGCCLRLHWVECQYCTDCRELGYAPVIPRSRSTLSLSRTCSFLPDCFFCMVPVIWKRVISDVARTLADRMYF